MTHPSKELIADEQRLASADAVYLDAGALLKAAIHEGQEDPDRVARLVVGPARLRRVASVVAFGEMVGRLNQMNKYPGDGIHVQDAALMRAVRSQLQSFKMGEIEAIEPCEQIGKFIVLMERLRADHPNRGGTDLWHLASMLNFLEAQPCALVMLSYDKKFCATARKEGIAAANGWNLRSAELVDQLKSAGRWP